MQISPLTIYAIQALQELRKNGPLPGEEIARRLDISRAYAKKTLFALKKSRLVKSKQRAGYVIVGRPKLLQVVEATEGIYPALPGETKAMGAIRKRLLELVVRGLDIYVTSL